MTKPKAKNILKIVRDALRHSRYVFSKHAFTRRNERNISYGDVLYVLENGWREEKKDEWKEEFQDWNYAIRGKTKDGVRVRISVAVQELKDGTFVVIVTVINLDMRRDINE